MLIIAPVVILAISGFVALMITMIGDSLATRDSNTLTFETQDALERIEDDTRLTTQFLTTTNTLPSPQGSDSNYTGTAAFTNTSNTLIMGGLTTDKNPVDTSRQLVFYANQPNDCGTLQNYNRPFQEKIIYFINNGSLWRRSVVPDYNTTTPVNDSTVCSAPWQQNSCSPGYTGSRCQRNDIEVMKNISSFTIKYLSSPSSDVDLGAGQALSANAIEVIITGQKTVKGRVVTSTGTIRGTKLNSIDVDLPIPNAPTVTASTTPTSAIFNWALVPNATSYLISYNINGGSWINTTVDNRTTSYTVNANRNDTVTIQVTSKNSTGTSATYGTAAATIPAWTNCDLPTNWSNYSTTPGYAGAAYTKTNNDIVVLKGTIKSSAAASDGTIVCTLPVGLRPAYPLIFQNSSPDAASRIDVWPDGKITITGASASWVSLENIRFVASTAAYPWNNLTLTNLWTVYTATSGYPPALQYATDSVGRVHLRGMIVQGTYTNPTAIATFPAGKRPAEYQHFPARGANGFNYMGISAAGNIEAKGINPNGWYSPQTIFYPSGVSTWTAFTTPLGSSWTAYAGFPTFSYTKASDGLVTLKGLIRSGTSSGTVAIGQLPAGYRPKEKALIHVVTNGGYGRIDIDTDGKIYGVVTNGGWLSFDNVSFIAEL